MKIYQCIHKYPPHIPAFERRWGIGDHSSFAEIHDALIRDGYASVYRLVPSPSRSDDEVFFVVWNYERLQHVWAKENGISTLDLDEIRLAQIESFKPDIVYDFSYFVSPEFINKVRLLTNAVTLCWYAYIKSVEPPMDIPYHGILSLHRPYVDFWTSKGIDALELQPAINTAWLEAPFKNLERRKHDLLFYGQVTPGLYGERLNVISGALKASRTLGVGFTCLTQYHPQYHRLGRFLARRGLKISSLQKWPDRELSRAFQKPRYGSDLYDEVRDAKITLNTFGDFNGTFKSNMRIFEAIGNGSILLTPRGVYPDNLVENEDYLAFENDEELVGKVREVFADQPSAEEFCLNAQRRIAKNFSKERQYDLFHEFASGL